MILAKYILISSFLLLLGCSGQSDQTSTESTDQSEEKTAQEIAAEDNWKQENIPPASSIGNNDRFESDREENRPPKIDRIEIQMLSSNPRDGFKAIVSANDPEGDLVDYIYQWKYNGEDIIGETEQVLTWQDEFVKGNKISIEVIPYDNEVQGIWKSEGTFTIPNSPPQIESTPPGELNEGKFQYTVDARDPDGDNIIFNINNAPEGMSFNEDTQTIEWNVEDAISGTYKIEIIVSDDQGAATTQILDLSVNQPNT